jgi:hypothetical protein
MIPYKITGGKVLDTHKKLISIREPQLAARRALASEFGATGTWATSTQVHGLSFKAGTQPTGWIHPQKGDEATYWPPGRSKADKALRARFRSLPLEGTAEFQDMLGMGSLIMSGMRIVTLWPELIEHEGKEILIVHVPDCKESRQSWEKHCLSESTVELNKSEYHMLKGE